MCNIEKHIRSFYRQNSEGKDCSHSRGLKRYYENKCKTSDQQKNFYEKSIDKNLLEKKNNRCIQFRDLVRS